MWPSVYHVSGPNDSPFARFIMGRPRPSAVVNGLVFPHHDCMVFRPIVPFFGYCRMKKLLDRRKRKGMSA